MNEAIEIIRDFQLQSKMLRDQLRLSLSNLFEQYFELCGYTHIGSSAELIELITNGLLIQICDNAISIFPVDYAEPLVDYSDKGRFEYNNLTMAQLKKCVATVNGLDRCELAKAICKATVFSTQKGE